MSVFKRVNGHTAAAVATMAMASGGEIGCSEELVAHVMSAMMEKLLFSSDDGAVTAEQQAALEQFFEVCPNPVQQQQPAASSSLNMRVFVGPV